MSTATPPAPRHALNMPAGSIRALLAIGILLYMWVLAISTTPDGDPTLTARDAEGKPTVLATQASLAFIYLQFLMVLILAHFFSAHGKTIGGEANQSSPLHLPSGTVRVLLLLGYLGLAYYTWQGRSNFILPDTGPIVLLLLVLLSAFFIGYVITAAMRFLYPSQLPPWFLDVQAWFAIVGLLLLGVVAMSRLINTKLPGESQIDLNVVEAVLAGIVGFYFGARS